MMNGHQGALACPNWAGRMQLSAPNRLVTNGVGDPGEASSPSLHLERLQGWDISSPAHGSSCESGGSPGHGCVYCPEFLCGAVGGGLESSAWREATRGWGAKA